MTPTRRLGRLIALSIFVGLGSGLFWADGAGRADPVSGADEKTIAEETADPDAAASEKRKEAGGQELPVYIPPPRRPVGERVGAATRGPAVALALLAPDHVGHTTAAQPVLYWSIGEETENDVVISVATDLDRTTEPLLEVVASRSPRAGIHAVPLAEHGVSLEPGETYLLAARLVIDPKRPWRNPVAYGAVERVEPAPKLLAELAATDPDRHYLVYARHGIWFDALQQLSEQIEQRPHDRGLRTARAVLLEQVEHGTAGVWDREFAPSP